MTANLERAERAVVCFLLLEPGASQSMPAAVRKTVELAPRSFQNEGFGKLAHVIQTRLQRGDPIDAASLLPAMARSLHKEFDLAIAEAPLPPDLAEIEARTVLEAFSVRLAKLSLGNALSGLDEDPDRARQMLRRAADTVDSISGAAEVCARAIGEFAVPEKDDPAELLKHRFLCQRGGLLIPGPTGMGKSSFVLQCFALWSNGLPCFDIAPARPLRCLLIQAENDEGDMAQMRDGIATGLEFTQERRCTFFQNVLIHDSAGITGRQFCSEVVRPLLDRYPIDIIGIDPALSFVGGDVKEQKIVGDFLRGHLNPLLFAHNCACVLLHHTNKPPTGREKPDWRNGEFAYAGSGSAEWAQWARAVLTMQSTGVPGLYRLHAAKRGARLGWKDAGDLPVYEKLIRHSREKGIICWHEADPDEADTGAGRPAVHTSKQLLSLLSPSGLTSTDWRKIASDELGISKPTFFRYVKELESAEKILRSKINNLWQPISRVS